MADGGDRELRLFVACELPAEVRSALGAIQEDLRRLDLPRLRWTRTEGIHVTLKFLGAVEASRVDAMRLALEAAVTPFELRLRLSSLGGFGGARVRVVWAGLDGDVDGLASLAEAVDGALTPLGFSRERRPFAAHLTLARVPDQLPATERRKIGEVIDGYRSTRTPSMILTRVALMRSILGGPGGAVYERLAAFPPAAGGQGPPGGSQAPPA